MKWGKEVETGEKYCKVQIKVMTTLFFFFFSQNQLKNPRVTSKKEKEKTSQKNFY